MKGQKDRSMVDWDWNLDQRLATSYPFHQTPAYQLALDLAQWLALAEDLSPQRQFIQLQVLSPSLAPPQALDCRLHPLSDLVSASVRPLPLDLGR